MSLDVAADGDIEGGTRPGFGRFGRQDMFRAGVVNGTTKGSDIDPYIPDVNLRTEDFVPLT